MAALESRSASDAARMLSDLEEEAYNPFQLLVADDVEAWLTVYRDQPGTVPLGAGVHVVGNVENPEVGEIVERGRARNGGVAEDTSGEPRALKLTRVRERVEKMMAESSADLLEGLAAICREHVGENGSAAGADQAEHRDGSAGSAQREGIAGEALADLGEGFQELAGKALESTCVHVGDRYGTRSSLLLELAEDRDKSRLWTTDGPPCRQPYEDLSPLLVELDLRSALAAVAQHEARTNR